MKKLGLWATLLVVAALAGGSCHRDYEKTFAALEEAIVGESNAMAKYTAYAEKSAAEGHVNLARLFTAVAAAEAIHLDNHMAALAALGGTYDPPAPHFDGQIAARNIEDALHGEIYETDEMFPRLVRVARTEKAEQAAQSFQWALEAEANHAVLFSQTLEALSAGGDSALTTEWHVCPTCGNVLAPPNDLTACKICDTAAAEFIVY